MLLIQVHGTRRLCARQEASLDRYSKIDNPKEYECRINLSDNGVLLGRPDSVVIDGVAGRRIELQSVGKIDQMLEEARLKGYEVRYTCKSRDPNVSSASALGNGEEKLKVSSD
jgi:hypothetical protein